MINPEERQHLKRHRAELITRCIVAIAEHCGVKPEQLVSETPWKGRALQEAKGLLAYHLYACGMSFESIARVMRRSVDHVRRLEGQGAIRMMGDDRKLIDSLPKIPTTLEIVNLPQ